MKPRSARPKRGKRASKADLNTWQSTGALSEKQRAKFPNGLEPPLPVPERDPVRPPIPHGARVRLTGKFLASTGQIAGGEGQKIWKVRACACGLCETGRFICVNQRTVFDNEHRWRHIAIGNLEDLDRLARQEEAGRKALLEREKSWLPLLKGADKEKSIALKKYGRDSHQYKRACEKLDFLNVQRARTDSDRAYIEATGEKPWYFSKPGPLDMVRIATKGLMPVPTGIEIIYKEESDA